MVLGVRAQDRPFERVRPSGRVARNGALEDVRNRLCGLCGPDADLTGAIIGTPFYIAPELLHGSRHAQPPSDVFSLGVLAFELLVGSMPFADPPVVLGRHGPELAVPSPLRRCSGLGLELAELFERCLGMDPERRPTAQEIASRLQSA